jgi:hypothetical protein
MKETSTADVPETAWVAASWQLLRKETAAFLRTAAFIIRHPTAFGDRWLEGSLEAQNPLGFFATAAGIFALINGIGSAAFGGEKAPSLVTSLLDSVGPYLHFAILALLTHPLYRATGSKRTVRGSIAMALYIGGGPMLLATLLNSCLFALFVWTYDAPNLPRHELTSLKGIAFLIAVFGVRIMGFALFAAALAGFHRARLAWSVAVLGFALCVTGLFFGVVNPPGNYGLRFAIGYLGPDGVRQWSPTWTGY